MHGQHLSVSAIAGLSRSAMVSAEAGWGEGYGPVAVPVFKTELRGVSCADGSTPSLLRQVLFQRNASRHKVLRIKNTAQIEQERVVVNPAQDGWLGLPKTLGDFFRGQLAMPNGNDRAGEFLLG